MSQEHFPTDPYQDQEWVHAQKKKLIKDSIQSLILLIALTCCVIIITFLIHDISFLLDFLILFSIITIAGCIVLIMSIKRHIIVALNLYKRKRATPKTE